MVASAGGRNRCAPPQVRNLENLCRSGGHEPRFRTLSRLRNLGCDAGSRVWSLLLARPVEILLQSLERRAGRLVGYLGVDLHSDVEAAMPEYLHGHPRVNLQGREQQAARVAGVVNADHPDTSPRAPDVECAVDVARLDRPAGPRREYQVAFLPLLPRTCAGRRLALLA